MAGIQTVDVPNAFGHLELDDLSVDAGQIDPETLVATYPIESGWVNMQPIICSLGSQALGGWRTWYDTSTSSSAFPTSIPDVTKNRWYTNITITLAGGATTPIVVQLAWLIGSGSWNLYKFPLTNPTKATVSNIFVPAGYTLRITNGTSGAGGDTMTPELIGFQASPGVALPMLPGATFCLGV